MGAGEKERRRKCLYESSVAERWTEMKTEKCQWTLVAVLVTGTVLGGEGWGGRSWIRVGFVIF